MHRRPLNRVLTVILAGHAVSVSGIQPGIVTPPQSQTVLPGATVAFSVVAAGSVPLSYQWYFNSLPIIGATNDRVTLANVNGAFAGDYHVVVNNPAGTAVSSVARLTVTSSGQPGTRRWTFQTGGSVYSSAAVAQDGTIYFGSRDRKFYALFSSGTKKWERLLPARIFDPPAIGPDGTIYIGTENGILYALAASNGQTRWQLALGDPNGLIGSSIGFPAIDTDGTIYVKSEFRGRLYALNPDRTEKWQFNTGGPVPSPSIRSDQAIYIGHVEGSLYALNFDGSVKWRHKLPPDRFVVSSASIDSDGTIYFIGREPAVGFVGDDYRLYALRSDTGSKKWDVRLFDTIPSTGPDGVLYTAAGGVLGGLFPQSGGTKWLYDLYCSGGGSCYYPGCAEPLSQFAIAQDGAGWISDCSTLYGVDKNGALKWQVLPITGFIELPRFLSQPTIDSSGTI